MSMFTPVFIPVSAGVTEYGGGARAVAARTGANKNTKSSKNVGDKDSADAKKGASKFSLKSFKPSKNVGDKENAGNGADAKKDRSKFSLKTFKLSKKVGDKENAGKGADATKGGSKFSFSKFNSSKNVADKKNADEQAAAKSNDSKAVSAFAIPRALHSLTKRTSSKTGEKIATPIASPGHVEVQSGEKTATLIASPAQEAIDAGEKDVNGDKEDDVALPRVNVPISRGLAEILKSMMSHIALGMVGAGAATNGGESPATFDLASTESGTPHMPGWLFTHASIHDHSTMPASFSTQAPSCYPESYTESVAEMVQGLQRTADEASAGIGEAAERRRQYDLQTSESILELKNNVEDRRQWSAADEPTEETRRGWISSLGLHDAASLHTVANSASFKTATNSASLKTAPDFGSQRSIVSYATLPPLDTSSSSCWSFGDSGPTTPDLQGHLDFIDRDYSPVVTQKPDITSSLSIVWDAELAELWLAADALDSGNTSPRP